MTVSIDSLRQSLQQGRQRLDKRFIAGGDVFSLLRARARLVDGIIKRAFANERELQAVGLFAVGGYGRNELFPFSDVDILVLHADDAMPQQAIGRLLSTIWDVGLRPGHSVRTLAQCHDESKKDLTVLTAMLEARQLCGDPLWHGQLRDTLAPEKLWSVPEFFRARLGEQTARREKYASLMHNLEPSIKESCGGLRDLHMLYWIALRRFAEGGLNGLWHNAIIDATEKRKLRSAQQVLSRLRHALHLVADRAEERLLFAHQRAVAAMLYADDSQRMVEQMMREFCQAAATIDLHNEIVLSDFAQRILPSSRTKLRALDDSFVIRDSRLELRSDTVLRQRPEAIVTAFSLLARRPRLIGLNAASIRMLRDYAATHGTSLLDNGQVRQQMLDLLSLRGAGKALSLMHRYGVLDVLLPSMARVRGLTQFDLFHVHSVDVHTLLVLHNLDNFFARREEDYPEYNGLAKTITRPEILYLAGIFHDIGKGRGGDHSTLGADDAEEYCRLLQLDEHAVQMVAWLVRQHLLMSHTAQKKDIDDAVVCDSFANQVQDVEHLNYLYLLTAADIRGTNPKLWNNWKHHLLSTLYRRALSRLRRSQDQLPQDRLRERQEQALALLPIGDAKAARDLWGNWHQDTFRRYLPEEIALQTRQVLRNPDQQLLLLLQPRTSRSCTEVFLYMPTRDDGFAMVTKVLDSLSLNIVDARIIMRERGEYALDNYSMLEQDGSCVRSRSRIEEIRKSLNKALRAARSDKPVAFPQMRIPAELKHFKVPTEVNFIHESQRIIMEVTALDQPGLLCRIATILYNSDVPLLGARVATFGERAEDVFYLPDNIPQQRCMALREQIIAATGFAEPGSAVATDVADAAAVTVGSGAA